MKKLRFLTVLLCLFIVAHCFAGATQYDLGRKGSPIPSDWFRTGRLRDVGTNWAREIDALVSGGENSGTGTTYYVDSNVTVEGDGSNWSNAKDTLDEAINLCTANAGDKILVAQGHAETIAAANGWDADIAGITIEHLGNGSLMGTYTFSATGSTVSVGAANITIIGGRMLAGISEVVTGIDVTADADYLTVIAMEFPEPGTSTFEFDVSIQLVTGADNVSFIGCTAYSADATGATSWLDGGAAVVNKLSLVGNLIHGEYLVSAVFSDQIDLENYFAYNDITNMTTAQHCIENTAASTGMCIGNNLFTDAESTTLDPGSMKCFDNLVTTDVDVGGMPIPVHDTGLTQLNATTIAAINAGITGVGFRATCEANVGGTAEFTAVGMAGFGNDYFNTGWSVICILDAGAPGTLQEGEVRDITDYISSTGVFTVDAAFSAAVTTGDGVYIRRNEDMNFDDVTLAGTSGTIWYCDDGGSGGDGRTWQTAFATLATAEAAMSAGDICYIGANHNENITTGGDVLNIAGTTFIGLGEGDSRPLFDFDAVADELTIDNGGITLKNLRFRPGATVVVAAIRVEDAALGVTLENCTFEAGEAADEEFIDCISVDSLAAGLTIINCNAVNANATAGDSDTWLNLDEATITDVTVIGCTVFGTFDEAPIWGGAAVPTNILVKDNVLTNNTTGQLAIEFAGAATGMIANNKLAGDTYGAILDPGSARCYDNTQTVGINTAAIDVPLKLGQTYVLTASVDEVSGTIFDVQNGEIMIHNFVGLVDVLIGANATNCRIDVNADDGAAFDVELSTNVAVETDVAGTRYVFTDANPGVLTPLLKGGTEGSATLHSSWFVPEGLIEQTMSADPGGAAGDHITWYMVFTPLVEGVVVVPGT